MEWPRMGEGGNAELMCSGHTASVWEDEIVLDMDNGDGCQTM